MSYVARAENRVRREVHYEGLVQGVGFRYTARAIAARHAVSGFVRNLADGRVHLVVEGAPADVQRFLAELQERMDRFIEHASQREAPATGEFSDFSIR